MRAGRRGVQLPDLDQGRTPPLYRTYSRDVDEVIAEDPLRVLFKFKRTNNRQLP